MIPWTLRPLPQTQTPVGLCAWRASMLLDHADYLREHPSLMVTHPDDSLDHLASLAPLIQNHPVMLSIREPQFSRRVPELILQRLASLKITSTEFLTLYVEDPSDLKSGSTFQHLYDLREKGVFKHIALAHHDIRMVEWLALHTPVSLLAMPYHLVDQSARHRALTATFENGMIPLALGPNWFSEKSSPANKSPGNHGQSEQDLQSIRFALAESGRVLSVLESPIPRGVDAMTLDEVEASWQHYSSVNSPPDPLPRSVPPE